jgi:NAD(P)-dependent dehydrogenase (short-subunit alcohol dehydrogenase family)
MSTLDGKIAIVMGAASRDNMGQSIARRFLSEGAMVMIAGRDERELKRFSDEHGAPYHRCDIADEGQLAELVSRTKRELGALDIAVNAAGVNQVKPLLEVSRAELQEIIDVQLIGAFLFMQAVLREMADGGSIIQISSVSASAMLPNHVAYMATKAAADVLVRSAALEFGARGIRVNSIAPGPTLDTPMAAAIMRDEAAVTQIKGKIPLGRLGTAADIAEAALWLASDRAFITGEVLQINGGRAIPKL